jgi:methylmalonyl-CoA mutase, C-terminal domain
MLRPSDRVRPPDDIALAALARHLDAEGIRGGNVERDLLTGENALGPAVPIEQRRLPGEDEQAGEQDHDARGQGRDHPGETEPATVRTERADLRRRLQAGRTELEAPLHHEPSIPAEKACIGRGTLIARRSIDSSAMAEKLRVIVAKPGLDGHDRGAKVVARALRDAGFEVIYTGLFQTPEQIAEAAIQEDADAVGLSCHSGAHMTLFPKVVNELRARGAEDVVVVAGGVIPADDIPKLKEAGIEAVFTPGANTGDIATWLRDRLSAKA